jgi:hypothetical protein
MKRKLYLLVGLVIISQGCQTNSELTDSDKDAMVQAVKQASTEYWNIVSQTYDDESLSNAKKYIDENSDQMWQTEPVASIIELSITNKRVDNLEGIKSMFERRISTPVEILETHYSVLSDDKVLEVHKGNFSELMRDSTFKGPFPYVATVIWTKINGEWKQQFVHYSLE